jgi:hypothetical protein
VGLLPVGNRIGPDVGSYPVDPVAQKRGAGVDVETPHPEEAYTKFTRPAPPTACREEFLAD